MSSEWPNLFLIGAPRCGTTTLHAALGRHPQVFMSPVKEPFFFVPLRREEVGRRRIYDERGYLSLFAGAQDEPVRGESSATYLWTDSVPARIRAVRPDAKIVVILREPVERAYSHYLLARRELLETRPFLQAIEEDLRGAEPPQGVAALRALLPGASSIYVDPSRYCESLTRWLDTFGDSVLVLFYEEAFRDPRGALRRIFELVGVAPELADRIELPELNPYARHRNRLARALFGSRVLRRLAPGLYGWQPFQRLLLVRDAKPPIDPEVRRVLEPIYAGERPCLRKLLGVEPPW